MTTKDTIIAQTHYDCINGLPAQFIELHNKMVIVITSDTLACYRNLASIQNPLGNGLVSLAEIEPSSSIQFTNGQCISAYRSGYVGLQDGKTILITPFKVRLYPSNHDGLRNLNCLAELNLPEIDVY